MQRDARVRPCRTWVHHPRVLFTSVFQRPLRGWRLIVSVWRISLKKAALGSAGQARRVEAAAPRPVASAMGGQLGEFAEVPGGGGEEKLVSSAAGGPRTQPVELQDSLLMSEKHLDLLPLSPGGDIGVGRGDLGSAVAAAPWMERVTLRAGRFRQHRLRSEQASQSVWLAR